MHSLKVYLAAALAMSASVWASPTRPIDWTTQKTPDKDAGKTGGKKGDSKGKDDSKDSDCFAFSAVAVDNSEKYWLLEEYTSTGNILVPYQDQIPNKDFIGAIFTQPQGAKGPVVDAQHPATLVYTPDEQFTALQRVHLSAHVGSGETALQLSTQMTPEGIIKPTGGLSWATCFLGTQYYVVLVAPDGLPSELKGRCKFVTTKAVAMSCNQKLT